MQQPKFAVIVRHRIPWLVLSSKRKVQTKSRTHAVVCVHVCVCVCVLTEVYKHLAVTLPHVLWHGEDAGHVVVQEGILLLQKNTEQLIAHKSQACYIIHTDPLFSK